MAAPPWRDLTYAQKQGVYRAGITQAQYTASARASASYRGAVAAGRRATTARARGRAGKYARLPAELRKKPYWPDSETVDFWLCYEELMTMAKLGEFG